MKKTSFTLSLMVAVFALFVTASEGAIQIKYVAPQNPKVEQGKSFAVRLEGDNLNNITAAEVIIIKKTAQGSKAYIVKDVKAIPGKYAPPKGSAIGKRIITLAAEPNARIGGNYQLVVFEGQGKSKKAYYLKSIDIEVISTRLQNEAAKPTAPEIQQKAIAKPQYTTGIAPQSNEATKPTAPEIGSQSMASPQLKGNMRWSPISMLRRTDKGLKPVGLDGASKAPGPTIITKFDSNLIQIKKMPEIPFKPFDILDPGKEVPTKIDPSTIFHLPNGESMTAKEYYGELNRLEGYYNKQGYSLDFRRQPKEAYDYGFVPKAVSVGNLKPKLQPLTKAPIKSNNEIQQIFNQRIERSKKILLSNIQKSGPPPVAIQEKTATKSVPLTAKTQERTQLKEKLPLNILSKEVPATILAPQLQPAGERVFVPYKETVQASLAEFGSHDLFGAYLEAVSELSADLANLNVIHTGHLGIWVLGRQTEVLHVDQKTHASYSGGKLQFSFDGMLFGSSIAIPLTSKDVPSVIPSQMNPFPVIQSGPQSFSASPLPITYETAFMIGPIPVSFAVGANASAGINYNLGANPGFSGSFFTPWVLSEGYAQGGLYLGIASAGAGIDFILLNAHSTQAGILERNGDSVDVYYEIYRDYDACSGDIYLYVSIYVPAFHLPPWKKKTFKQSLVNWNGWRDSGYIAQRQFNHPFYEYRR